MNIFERAKNILYSIATFNSATHYPWGGIAASLIAYPLVMMGRMIYLFSIDLFYNFLILFMILFLGMIQFVLDSLPIDRRNDIVINRLLGIMIGYYYIPFQFKFILISLLIFHMLRAALPKIIISQWKIDLEACPGLAGTISLDIITGITSNICIHLLRLLLG